LPGERATGARMVLCGDLNVALEERDVHPKLRKPNEIGQRPEERALVQRMLDGGLVDLLRRFDPENDNLFTWWAPWRNLKERNIGWGLDYCWATPDLAGEAKACACDRGYGTSDHGPVTAVFETALRLPASKPGDAPRPVGQMQLPLGTRSSGDPCISTATQQR